LSNSGFWNSARLASGSTVRMNIWNYFSGSPWDFLPAPIDVFEEMQIILMVYSFNRSYWRTVRF